MSSMPLEQLRAELIATLRMQQGKSGWRLATSGKEIPIKVGVYVVYNALTKRVEYVGSGELKARTSVWFRKKWPCYVKWKVWKRQWMALCVEMELIQKLKPSLNQRGLYKVRLGERLSPKQITQIAERGMFEGKELPEVTKKALKEELAMSLRDMKESRELVDSWGVLPAPKAEDLDLWDIPSPPKVKE